MTTMTWDQLQEGDVLLLPKIDMPGEFLRIKLLLTCRNCQSPELFNCICDCKDPDCPREVQGINVRRCFENPGIFVERDSEKVGKS